ncbi:MAG: hypothetical protein ACYDEE_09605 [Ignavibacteriaceae bacterium]
MNSKPTINELIDQVLSELERLNYAYGSRRHFRSFYKKLSAFACQNDEIYFSEELGRKYLKEKYNCIVDYFNENIPRQLKDPIREIRILGDYQLHEIILRRIVKKPGYVKPPQFKKELVAYEKECEIKDYSKRGLRTRMQRLFFFIDYLNNRKISNVNEITPLILSDYVKTIIHHHEKSISAILTTLRVFLNFLYINQFTNEKFV